MTNKLILIGIGIAAIGLIALPQTLALFAGQHDFYETSRTPPYGVPCAKCHADVYSELAGSDVHDKVACEGCHILALTYKGAKVGGNESIHAAGAPACLDCHDGKLTTDQWHGIANASGTCAFGEGCHGVRGTSQILDRTNLTYRNATSILYGANESHKKFAFDASNATLLKGANEACVGCHTHTYVDIAWEKPTNLSFKASVSSLGVWNVTNFTASGVKKTNTTG